MELDLRDGIVLIAGKWMAPLCAQHYEAGAEVAELLPAAVERRGGATYLDMGRIVSDQALAAGVPAANISTADVCTCERDDLGYSYRRDRMQFGNQ